MMMMMTKLLTTMAILLVSQDEYGSIKRQYDPLLKSQRKKEESLMKYNTATKELKKKPGKLC